MHFSSTQVCKYVSTVLQPAPFQPALLNFDSEIDPKMEMLDYSDFVDTVTGMKEEEVRGSENDNITDGPDDIPLVQSTAKKKKTTSKKKPTKQPAVGKSTTTASAAKSTG